MILNYMKLVAFFHIEPVNHGKCSDLERNNITSRFLVYSSLKLSLTMNDFEGAPPHWSANVRDYLDEHLHQRWFGQVAEYNMPLLPNELPEVLT
ncbi:hypothetical protein TNCV_2339591 [Trichonephila clavipes]|nr:hypothetical protein TNCV_2339591 [Trichonephila clavipes]